MLLFTKETEKDYVEIHTSAFGSTYRVIEFYEKTPKGKIKYDHSVVRTKVVDALIQQD